MTTNHGQLAQALRRSHVAPQCVLDVARTLQSEQGFDRPAFLTAAVSEIWFTGEACRLAWVAEHENWATNVNKSEADKRRDVIRDAVNFELEQGPKFTSADWAEAKDRTLESLLSAHIDSLVDCYWDERPTGQALFDLVEEVRIGSDILGVDYVSQLHDPTAPLTPPVDERDEGMDIGSDREPDQDPDDDTTLADAWTEFGEPLPGTPEGETDPQ